MTDKFREERSFFIVDSFSKYIGKEVLDVGCWNSHINKYLDNGIKYIGIDIDGKPTYKVDLEKEKLDMFENKSFDTVVCSDVLEHLENIHEVFDELCRVTKNYLIISLPNNYTYYDIKGALKGDTINNRYYGLPLRKPQDRHKWFFNYDQAYKFIKFRSKKNKMNIVKIVNYPDDVFLKTYKKFIKFLLKILYGRKYNNVFISTIWVVLEKKSDII